MRDLPTPETLREFAAKLVREAHEDYEFSDIGEQMDGEDFTGLTEDQFDEVQETVSGLISSAVVAVSWPNEDADALTAAYRERAHLLALLAAQYPSHIGYTDDSAPDWAVLTVELPTGQACWHIATGDMDLFAHVDQEPAHAIAWDGHSTEEKYRRIDEHAANCACHCPAGMKYHAINCVPGRGELMNSESGS